MPNLLLFSAASFCIILITGLVHFCTKKEMIPIELGRKILHLLAILICAYVIAHTEARELLGVVFLGAAVLLFYITQQNILLPSDRKSYGIALFPVAFGVLLLSPLSKPAVLLGVLTLGLSDAAAGLIGTKWGLKKIRFLAEYKSWIGFLAFYVTTVFIAIAFIGMQPVVLLLALIPALTELFSYRGSDNLAVPIVTAAWFAGVRNYTIDLPFVGILCALFVFGAFVLQKKWLTEAGAAAAALLAVVIMTLCGSWYLLPLLVFFAVGSLASKLHSKPKEQSGRDAYQVFSNGLVPTLCLCVYAATGDQVYAIAYFAAVCIHLTDTISSDIGTYFGQKTYDILTFKPTSVGMSGGVSVAGTLSGVAAAFCFSAFIWFVFNLTYTQAWHIALLGVAGMTLDSLMGSRFQAKYIWQGTEIETNQHGAQLTKGWSWLHNDLVNLLSNALLILVYLLCE
jgi:uncharacterized protein (TIGR00297 family)